MKYAGQKAGCFLLWIVLWLGGKKCVLSQNTELAREVLHTLCSPQYAGRGWANNGEWASATYLASVFQQQGLQPLGEGFLQPFEYKINVIEDTLFFYLDDTLLVPGEEYIPQSATATLEGEYDLIYYNEKNLPTLQTLQKLKKKKFFHNKLIVLDFLLDNLSAEKKKAGEFLVHNYVEAEGIITISDRLMYDKSVLQSSYGIISVKRGRIKSSHRKAYLHVKSSVKSNKSANVVAWKRGVTVPDSFIVFTAHYDHLGKAGQLMFAGANDNASGVAMLLMLAAHFSQKTSRYSVAFIAFGGEEAGLLGSKYFVMHPLIPLNKIKFLINFDILGTGEEGITVVNATLHHKEFELLQQLNAEENLLKQIKPRGKAAISDHHFFTEAGVPCFYIYTMGGVPYYHDILDKPETLSLHEFQDIFRLITLFIARL